MKRHGWLLVYVASTVLVNVLWGVVPWVGSFVVGGIFMVRDVAQDRSGRWVLAATALGIAFSYAMASPGVAIASAGAFAVSELSDFWMVAKLRNRTLRQRMLITQPANVFLDTAVFMVGLMLGIGLPWSWSMFGVQVASKMAAIAVLAFPFRRLPEAEPSGLTAANPSELPPANSAPRGGKDGMHRPAATPSHPMGRLIAWSGAIRRAP